MRVLLVAETANPEWVSVPLVGWSHSRALAELAGVSTLVVTQVRNRDAFLRAGLAEGRDFVAIDNNHVAAPLRKVGEALRGGGGKGWTTLIASAVPAYYEFERLLCRELGGRIDAGEFDVVHRLTPLSPAMPSWSLPRRCRRAKGGAGVPFVVGPLNGGLPWPSGYDRVRRREREWLSYVRDAYRLLPGYRLTRRSASALIVGSRATFEQVPARYRDRCVVGPSGMTVSHAKRPTGRPTVRAARSDGLPTPCRGRRSPGCRRSPGVSHAKRRGPPSLPALRQPDPERV